MKKIIMGLIVLSSVTAFAGVSTLNKDDIVTVHVSSYSGDECVDRYNALRKKLEESGKIITSKIICQRPGLRNEGEHKATIEYLKY